VGARDPAEGGGSAGGARSGRSPGSCACRARGYQEGEEGRGGRREIADELQVSGCAVHARNLQNAGWLVEFQAPTGKPSLVLETRDPSTEGLGTMSGSTSSTSWRVGGRFG